MQYLPNLATLILMGGQNKRMNGEHKAFLALHEKTFLEHIIHNLSPYAPIYLSVNTKAPYNALNYPLIEDEYKEIGPIGGIYTALSSIQEEYVFITACDMPFVNGELITFLYDQLDATTSCVVMSDQEGRFYPLGGIYSKSILPLVKEHIAEGNYRLGSLLKRAHAKIIPLDQAPFKEKLLWNINTPEEYKRLL